MGESPNAEKDVLNIVARHNSRLDDPYEFWANSEVIDNDGYEFNGVLAVALII